MDSTLCYKGENVEYRFGKYWGTDRIALCLLQNEQLYATLTVNLPDDRLTDKNCAFIDTNNHGDGIVNWLERNNFGKLTGKETMSGFCIYPEFKFKEELLKDME